MEIEIQRFSRLDNCAQEKKHNEMLKNEDGVWLDSAPELEKLAVGYFQRLYSMDDVEPVVDLLPCEGFMKLTQNETRVLSGPFSEDEIVTAIRSMGLFKAPGPMGISRCFTRNVGMKLGSLSRGLSSISFGRGSYHRTRMM